MASANKAQVCPELCSALSPPQFLNKVLGEPYPQLSPHTQFQTSASILIYPRTPHFHLRAYESISRLSPYLQIQGDLRALISD